MVACAMALPAAAEPSADTRPTTVATVEPQAQPRRPDRVRQAPVPLQRRRTIEAPGAALMLIPASYTPQR